MKILLALIVMIGPAQAEECFLREQLKYKYYKNNLFLIYNESEKSISINEIDPAFKKKILPIKCQELPTAKIRALIEEKDSCVFSKTTRTKIGKLLFRVVNYSSENKLTLEIQNKKEVIGEGKFLATYTEQPCSSRGD